MGFRAPGCFLWLAAATANAVLLLGFSVNAQPQPPGKTPAQSGAPAQSGPADQNAVPPASAQPEPQSPASPQAQIQPPIFQPFFGIRAVATDNSALTTSDRKKGDLIGDVEAGLFLQRRSARMNLSGEMRLNFVGYADHTQPDRILPSGQVDLTAELLERAFFVDSAIEASRTRADVFAPQGVGPSTANTISTLFPIRYFARELTPEIFARASALAFIRNHGRDPAREYPARCASAAIHLASRQAALPLGISLQGLRGDTLQQREPDSADHRIGAGDPQRRGGEIFSWGHRGGITSNCRPRQIDGNRYGIMTQWRPALRTQLDAELEHASSELLFVHFGHRTPLPPLT
jgi:hypothetical protein